MGPTRVAQEGEAGLIPAREVPVAIETNEKIGADWKRVQQSVGHACERHHDHAERQFVLSRGGLSRSEPETAGGVVAASRLGAGGKIFTGASYFAALDVLQGLRQIPMDEECRRLL